MGKKKKKIAVNTIDAYIKQIKYRTKLKKPEKKRIRQLRVVIPRLEWGQLKDVIDPSKRKRKKKTFNNKVTGRLNSASLQSCENVLSAAEEIISRNENIPPGNQEDISQTGESSQTNVVSNEPCLCEPSNFGSHDFSEPNTVLKGSSIPNKYRSCMEELKSLTKESITKFVNENQQHYIDLRKANLAEKITANGKKKRKNEFKDSFKCNPFDSAQQIAMYEALRAIFRIPANSFLECRYFFTLLMPEICCQLFAQVFKVKISSAPRLIKKLYHEPVCPV